MMKSTFLFDLLSSLLVPYYFLLFVETFDIEVFQVCSKWRSLGRRLGLGAHLALVPGVWGVTPGSRRFGINIVKQPSKSSYCHHRHSLGHPGSRRFVIKIITST